MEKSGLHQSSEELWQSPEDAIQHPLPLLHLVMVGLFIGLCAGTVISVFRITTSFVYSFVIANTADCPMPLMLGFLALVTAAGFLVGHLIKNPAIRYGGAAWLAQALENGQPRAWRIILWPKFLGSWLVMACGISVGREGPCIQMGASTALGLHKIGPTQKIERRYYILGGGAAGLAAAFSAPFAGICYVYEVMNQKLDQGLFIFMLAGGIGVFVSCTQIFGLDVMLPMEQALMPSPARCWILVPLGIVAGIVGIIYNYLLRVSIKCWEKQPFLPPRFRPVPVFLAAGLMVLFFPAVTGEGLTVFPGMEAGRTLIGFLGLFLLVKLLFTAFCYGSGIPAGIMVPVLCLGGVTGGIYADCLQMLGIVGNEEMLSCVVMGMAGAFAAAEKAPVTALVLVAEMTGAWAVVPGLLFVSAIASWLAKVAKVKAA